MGTTPSILVVLPKPVTASAPGMSLATIADTVPVTNIATFGMCLSVANPAVQAATTAASGVFTPAPCVPATAGVWAPGSTSVAVRGVPAVPQTAVCNCVWAGIVSVVQPGQVGVQSV
jgi:hypothetical protein